MIGLLLFQLSIFIKYLVRLKENFLNFLQCYTVLQCTTKARIIKKLSPAKIKQSISDENLKNYEVLYPNLISIYALILFLSEMKYHIVPYYSPPFLEDHTSIINELLCNYTKFKQRNYYCVKVTPILLLHISSV